MPILTYHSLDGSGSVISTPARRFEAQMEILAQRGFQGITLDALLSGWEGAPLPEKPFVATFDDGYRSVVTDALPVMKRLGFRGTVFVVAGHLGGKNDWPGEPPQIPRLDLLDARDISRLSDEGWDVGSHGTLHAHLPRLSADAAAREIEGSRKILERELRRPVSHYAYAYGESTPAHRELCRGIYQSACGVRLAPCSPADDRFDLPRVDMYYFRSERTLRMLPTAIGRAYVWLRAQGRAVRSTMKP